MKLNNFVFSLIFCATIVAAQQKQGFIDKQGKKQGYFITYYPDSIKKTEGFYKDNYPEGLFKRYYPTGELKSVTQFSKKATIASIEFFSKNKQPIAKGRYVNQKKDSVWIFYNKKGLVASIETFKLGKKHGKSQFFYPDGKQIMEIIHYQNDTLHGTWEQYYTNSQLQTKGYYQNGKLEGPIVTYYPNGQINLKGNYSHDKKNGEWLLYDENGQILKKAIYKHGILESGNEFDVQEIPSNIIPETEIQGYE